MPCAGAGASAGLVRNHETTFSGIPHRVVNCIQWIPRGPELCHTTRLHVCSYWLACRIVTARLGEPKRRGPSSSS